MLLRAKTIAILVDDGTRPTPVAEILPVLLSHLEESGFSREKIAIVMAIGTHEAMEKEALEAKLGSGIQSRYKVIQHNACRTTSCPSEYWHRKSRENQSGSGSGRSPGRNQFHFAPPHGGYGGGPKL